MSKAYLSLLKYVYAKEGFVTFIDNGGGELEKCEGYKAAKDEIEASGMADVIVAGPNPKFGNPEFPEAKKYVKKGWAMVIVPPGVGDEESVSDFTDNEFMNAWWEPYYASI